MQCWLAGAFALDGDDDLARSIAVRLTSSSLGHLFTTRSLVVVGEVHAASFAEGQVVEGEVRIDSRKAAYQLRFASDDGTRSELIGTQELNLRRPPRGFSVVEGEIRQDNRTVGRARLRLDPRDTMRGIFSWA